MINSYLFILAGGFEIRTKFYFFIRKKLTILSFYLEEESKNETSSKYISDLNVIV